VTRSRQLLLLRHVKSSWDDASLPDSERPLAERGRRAAALVQHRLHAEQVAVDLVLCSPARRTRDTWDGVRAGVRSEPEVRFVPTLYAAPARVLLDALHGVDPRHRSVLLIGHNPGMEELAARLVGDGKPKALTRIADGFPTGALATLRFDAAWAELGRADAYLASFVRPRDLSGG
jgi:phosphohistidine phosphatase